MKIAFLSFYSGIVARGVETFVHELANRLVILGYEVTVYQNGRKLSGAKYKTVMIAVKVDWKKKGSYIPLVNYFGLRVREFTTGVLKQLDSDTDIVFSTNGQWQSILCRIWTFLRGKKLVISGQSGPGADDKMNLFTFPSAFISLTKHQVDWAKKVNSFVRVERVPNGVDLGDFSSTAKHIEIALPKPVVLCVSAFDKWKRLDLVIKAVAKVSRMSLLLVGKGSQEKYLQALGSGLLGKRFKIMSFPHDKMPQVYPVADIFTYPTVPWESFGIAMVEAMASGLPVVATDDPIRREIVGEAGLFVDPNDTDAYTKALKKALNTDWGDKPRKQAEKFDWDKIALEYEKLFKEITK